MEAPCSRTPAHKPTLPGPSRPYAAKRAARLPAPGWELRPGLPVDVFGNPLRRCGNGRVFLRRRSQQAHFERFRTCRRCLNDRLWGGQTARMSHRGLGIGEARSGSQDSEHSNHCRTESCDRGCFSRFHTLFDFRLGEGCASGSPSHPPP